MGIYQFHYSFFMHYLEYTFKEKFPLISYLVTLKYRLHRKSKINAQCFPSFISSQNKEFVS